jgi:hypothetical protein
MPWELTILRRDRQPLGTDESVRQSLGAAFPGVQFYRDPSGPEKIAAASRAGAPFPETILEFLQSQPAREQADWEQEGTFVRFFLGEPSGVIPFVLVEVRGDHARAEPLLRELARASGWGIDHWAVGGEQPFAG